MLLEFSVENFLSFDKKTTFSFVASKDDSHPRQVVKNVDGRGTDVLRVAALYGANASGKSNLIKAFRYFCQMVVRSAPEGQVGEPTRRIPFKLREGTELEPSRFEAVFALGETRYTYSFSVNDGRVLAEELRALTKATGKVHRIYARTTSKDTTSGSRFDVGRGYAGRIRRWLERSRENALALSTLAHLEVAPAVEIVKWFSQRVRFCGLDIGNAFPSAVQAHGDAQFRRRLEDYLNAADLGISRIQLEETQFLNSRMFKKLPAAVANKIREEVPADGKTVEVTLLHRASSPDGPTRDVPLDYSEESAGTLEMLRMAEVWESAFSNADLILIDEFGTALHPTLCRWLIRRFGEEAPNRSRSQLLVATHVSEVLDRELLRRDAIWIAEKQRDGSTDLYSLWDFKEKPRPDESLRKRYLEGRYGGVPLLGRVSSYAKK